MGKTIGRVYRFRQVGIVVIVDVKTRDDLYQDTVENNDHYIVEFQLPKTLIFFIIILLQFNI